jgi:hypothetical protein
MRDRAAGRTVRNMTTHLNRTGHLGVTAALALLILFGALHASSAEAGPPSPVQLYVAPWGDDGWSGTSARPFATVARAQRAVRQHTAAMRADVVVNLRGGTYALTSPLRLSPSAGDAGTGGHTVVYQAYGYGTSRQESPTISGGRAVTGWRPAQAIAGAWRADVGDLRTRQLFVDGRRARRTTLGRGLPGTPIMLEHGFAVRSTVPQSWRRPADMELVFNGGPAGLPYSEARCGVAGVRGDAKWTIVRVDEPCFRDLKQAYASEAPGSTPPPPTDVENSPSFLRAPGSWYLDRSRPGHHVLYYRPLRGRDPRAMHIVAPVLETLVAGAGTTTAPLHDVAFRGLTFAYATWLEPDRRQGFAQTIGSWYTANGTPSRMPGNVVFRHAERVDVEGDRFTHLGGQALVLSGVGRGNTLRGNVVDDVSGGGIEVRGAGGGNRVENTWVHHIGIDYRGSIGITLEGSPNAVVAHNQVNDVPYTGIWGESPRGLRVIANLVFAAVHEVPDGGGIYVPYAQGTSFRNGALVRGNVVRDTGSVGIYADVGADWLTVTRNVVYGQDNAVSGVKPRRIRLVGNFWDDGVPFWWPESAPTPGVDRRGNRLLRRSDPFASCRANARCAAILAAAGRLTRADA